MQSGFKGGRHEGGSSNGSNKDVTLFKSLFDFFGSALLTRCVCIFPFHASHGQTDWHESQARLVISLFEFDCLFPLSGGEVRSRPMWFCQSLHRASRGTVCLHHAGLPSAAVPLFQALFIDQKKTAVFDVSCFLSSARTFDHVRRD